MKKVFLLLLFASLDVTAHAQWMLSVDSCRAMALRNNKQLSIARLKNSIAIDTRKAARTNYLPKIDVMGGYEFTSRQISILSNEQKNIISNIGTTTSAGLANEISPIMIDLAQQGILTPQQASHLGDMFNKMGMSMGEALNQSGKRIVDAFDTDTKNVFMASVMLRQPIYMGGSITAANRMADIAEEMSSNDIEAKTQDIIYNVDQAYWTIISLKHKLHLANKYLELVKKLSDDVHKMIHEGVATRADGLKVDVKVNEAEMTVTQADNGLALARMYLCQLCGLPLDSELTLADESNADLDIEPISGTFTEINAQDYRPELKMLENAVQLSKQSTKLVRSTFLPQAALTAGYLTTNPNIYNGFENRFGGVWNVGVVVRIPVWSWFESEYKVRASKTATQMAQMELNDAEEKVNLQVAQGQFRLKEATKRMYLARRNVEHAEENLRCANLGFKEGVMQTTEVMEAQTAWLKSKSQKIDADIDVKLSQVNLQKAFGVLK